MDSQLLITSYYRDRDKDRDRDDRGRSSGGITSAPLSIPSSARYPLHSDNMPEITLKPWKQ